jgi:hypothetical protein
LKSIFSENLENIYRDIFLLVTKLHFTASYIESIPPIERGLYIQYAEEEAAKSKNKEQPKDFLFGTPIDPNLSSINNTSN